MNMTIFLYNKQDEVMLMGMAPPANNNKNVNANEYVPRTILATTRLSKF